MPRVHVIEELAIQLKADSKAVKLATDALNAMEAAAKHVGPSADRSFSKSVVKANLFTDALEKAAGAAVKLTGKIAGLPVDAFESFTKGAQGFDDIAKRSRNLGIPIEELQRLQYAATQSGISVDVLQDGLRTLNKNVQTALISGTGDAVKALELLGLKAKDLDKLSTIDRLKLIGDRLKYIAKQDVRPVAARLFGEFGGFSFQTLLGDIASFEKAMGQARVASEDAVLAGENYTSSLGRTKNLLQGFTNELITQSTPAYQRLIDETNRWIEANETWINQGIKTAVHGVDSAVRELIPHLKATVEETLNWINEHPDEFAHKVAGAVRDVSSAVGDMVALVREAARAWKDLKYGLEAIKSGFSGATDAGFAQLRVLRLEREANQKLIEAYKRRHGITGVNAPRVGELGAPAFAKEGRQRAPGFALEGDAAKLVAPGAGLLTLPAPGRNKAAEEVLRKRLAKVRSRILRTAGKKKGSKKKAVSGITVDDAIEALTSGENPTDKIKGLSLQTPSTKDIKPTVAIDYFNFVVNQTITTGDARQAGAESAKQIQATFKTARARKAPATGIVR